jgi:hypothetical protein
MNKIGCYDLFFDFFVFQSKRWAGAKKKVTISEAMAIFEGENFLNIGKKRNTLAIKSAEKKNRWLTNFRFFFASLWKKQTTNPALRSLRSLRLGNILFFSTENPNCQLLQW